MSGEMKEELKQFWNSIINEEKERLKEEFKNNMDAARIFKEIKQYENMMGSLYRANGIATFLASIEK